jgi:hypothetical protein
MATGCNWVITRGFTAEDSAYVLHSHSWRGQRSWFAAVKNSDRVVTSSMHAHISFAASWLGALRSYTGKGKRTVCQCDLLFSLSTPVPSPLGRSRELL